MCIVIENYKLLRLSIYLLKYVYQFKDFKQTTPKLHTCHVFCCNRLQLNFILTYNRKYLAKNT